MTQKKDDKVIIDIRITDVGSLPPQYFLHDAVIAALRDVVRSDVVVHGNPLPPGAQAIKGHPKGPKALEAAKRQLGFELKTAIRKDWHVFVIVFLAVLAGFVAIKLLGGI